MRIKGRPPFLKKTHQGGVLTIALNRPAKMNAVGLPMLSELLTEFKAAKRNGNVRAIILCGLGHKAFSAGGDLDEIALLTKASARAYSKKGQELTNFIENMGKPVIAAIEGYALGGGLELVMACNLRIASENAKLGLPEINHGIIPGWGGTARIVRAVGFGRAMKICLLGQSMTAREAVLAGLIHQVSTRGSLLKVAMKHAAFLAAAKPLAVSGIIGAITAGVELPLKAALTLERISFSKCCADLSVLRRLRS